MRWTYFFHAAMSVMMLQQGLRCGAQEQPEIQIHPDEQAIQVEEPSGIAELIETTEFIRAGIARTRYSVDGTGFSVAVMDTGINEKHVDFAEGTDLPAKQNFRSDGGPNDVFDGHGHGTNVAGIISANGDHSGIAPGSKVVPIKVINNKGVGGFAAIEKGLEWVVGNHVKYKISVVNLSIGSRENLTSDAFPVGSRKAKIREHIKALRKLRIPVVISAGNDFYFHKSKQGMSFPAVIRESISVGAVYDSDIGCESYKSNAEADSTAAGRITPFSQRLHSSFNVKVGKLNPLRTDVFAPGAPLTSTGNVGKHGESIMQGTSQSAPVTSGVILLMQQLHMRAIDELPEVDDLESYLRSGVVINDGDDEEDNVMNTGLHFIRVDAMDALSKMHGKLRAKLMMESVETK